MDNWMDNLRRITRMGLTLGTLSCVALGGTATASDHHWDHCGSDHNWVAATKLGVQLEGKLWEAVKDQDYHCYKKKVEETFQGLISVNNSWSGTIVNRHQELDLLKSVDLQTFDIYNAVGKLSCDGKTLTLSYTFVATGIINSHVFSINNNVISVWKKTKHGWQWISHGGFTPF